MNLCVVGLGQVGLPVALYASGKGLDVWGYDINPVTVENACKTGEFRATSFWEDIPKIEVYIICVTTSQHEGKPDLSPVFEVCKKIAKKAELPVLVSIESTITPGTCKKISADIFEDRINIVHAPHRYWAADPVNHGVNQVRVMGALNTRSLDTGVKFYEGTLGIPMHKVSSVEIAEMCKITENAHRYLQIAFSEELKMICTKIGLDFDEVRQACNTKWNVDMPEAREGIGGHCLPKDIKYVTSLAPSQLLIRAIDIDKSYRKWLTNRK